MFLNGVPDSENSGNLLRTSESIGAYSVSYANFYDYMQELSATEAGFQKSLKSTTLHYLGNTRLLFWEV